MAANRPTKAAPVGLLSLSKVTLADIVWELAAVAPGCTSCDDRHQILKVIREAALQVKAPSRDVKQVEKLKESWVQAQEKAAGSAP